MVEEQNGTPQQGNKDGHRSVELERTGFSSFRATNLRGGELVVGEGKTDDFTPVELLLVAIAGCSAIDVDYLTARRAEPTGFVVQAAGDKVRDEQGNHLKRLTVSFEVTFPEGPEGDAARAVLPTAVAKSRDRLCTVSRTVALGEPVEMDVQV